MPITNNVTRLLLARKIAFTPIELPAEKISALDTARMLNVSPETVFKTIVVVRPKPGKPVLAVIPATTEVDLKKVSAVLGEKKVSVPTQKEAEQLTGLQAGGISALALLNKGFQVLLDGSALELPEMQVSGGQRGLQIRLAPKAFIDLTRAKTGDITRPVDLSEDEGLSEKK